MNIDHPITVWIIRRRGSGALPFVADKFLKMADGELLPHGHATIHCATLAECRIEVLSWFRSTAQPAACIAAEEGDLTHLETWL